MLDLQTIDSVYSTSSIPFNYKYLDMDLVEQLNNDIKDQYINFNNIGIDLLDSIEDEEIKKIILDDLLNYVNENYTSIIGLESVFFKDTLEMGTFVYHFFCIDYPTMILPNFINDIECFSIKEFEKAIKFKFNYKQDFFKASIITCVKNILDQILKLSNIDKKISNDESYKKLVKKYSFYIDMIDFGSAENLLYQYTVPILRKHFEEILWRSN